MNKSRRTVKSFINFLYREYHVPRIPINVHWYAKSIVVGDHPCYGVCITDDDEPGKSEIHAVAGTKYGTGAALRIIAHEFVHYLQFLNGCFDDNENREETEDIAEGNGQALVCKFLQNRKKTGAVIYGTLEAWNRRANDN